MYRHVKYKKIISLLMVVIVWIASPAAAEIIWHAPVTVQQEVLPAPDGFKPQTCAVADSPFIMQALATRPQIVIVIDDMGVDMQRTAAITRLPGPLTLAYLPYARHIQTQVDAGRAAGHAIMMHVPMQPEDDGVDPGPNVLRADLSVDELHRRIAANLDAFSGYSGINNHMGSRFTQNRAGMDILMQALHQRGVFFLDSRTHPRSVAQTAAIAAEVMTAERDIFIDHVNDKAAVMAALKAVEKRARQDGSAIAIGHPKDVTIAALAEWLPSLSVRGVQIITLHTLLHRRQQVVIEPTPHTSRLIEE